jgi:hypothetical protein
MQHQQQVPIPAMAGMSPSEASSRVFSDDDKSDHGGGGRKAQPLKQEVPAIVDPTNRYVDLTNFNVYILFDLDYPLPERLLS